MWKRTISLFYPYLKKTVCYAGVSIKHHGIFLGQLTLTILNPCVLSKLHSRWRSVTFSPRCYTIYTVQLEALEGRKTPFHMYRVHFQSSLLGATKRGLHNVSNGARFLRSFVCVIYSQPVYSRGNWIRKIRHCINNLYLKQYLAPRFEVGLLPLRFSFCFLMITVSSIELILNGLILSSFSKNAYKLT